MATTIFTQNIPCIAPTMVTVRIQDREQTYTMVETTAPVDYDYAGIIEVRRYDANRFVLIPVLNLMTQVSRYLSGLYLATPSDVYDAQILEDYLWMKLKGDSNPT